MKLLSSKMSYFSPTGTTSSISEVFSPYSSNGGLITLTPSCSDESEGCFSEIYELDEPQIIESNETTIPNKMNQINHLNNIGEEIIRPHIFDPIQSWSEIYKKSIHQTQMHPSSLIHQTSLTNNLTNLTNSCSTDKHESSQVQVQSNSESNISHKKDEVHLSDISKTDHLTYSQHILRTPNRTVQVTEYFLKDINLSQSLMKFNSMESDNDVKDYFIQKIKNNNLNKQPLIFLPDVLCNCKLSYERMIAHSSFKELFYVYNVYFIDWPIFLDCAHNEEWMNFSIESFIEDLKICLDWITNQERIRNFNNIIKSTLIATGTGAYFGMCLAIQNPSFIKQMLLCACISDACGWKEWFGWKLTLYRLKLSGLSSSVCNDFLNILINTNNTEENVRRMFLSNINRLNQHNLYRFFDSWTKRQSIIEHLSKIDIRTKVFVGEFSAQYRQSKATYLSILPTISEFIPVDNCCNLITFEAPLTIVKHLFELLQEEYLNDNS